MKFMRKWFWVIVGMIFYPCAFAWVIWFILNHPPY